MKHNVVWKVQVGKGLNEIVLPLMSEALSFNVQDVRMFDDGTQRLCVWFLVNDSEKVLKTKRKIFVAFTGEPLPEDHKQFIGTAIDNRGLVYHAFLLT